MKEKLKITSDSIKQNSVELLSTLNGSNEQVGIFTIKEANKWLAEANKIY
jgi:hypothetical protein